MHRVASNGTIHLFEEIRDELGIRSGDWVTYERTDEGLLIRKCTERAGIEKWKGAIDTDEAIAERMEELQRNR